MGPERGVLPPAPNSHSGSAVPSSEAHVSGLGDYPGLGLAAAACGSQQRSHDDLLSAVVLVRARQWQTFRHDRDLAIEVDDGLVCCNDPQLVARWVTGSHSSVNNTNGSVSRLQPAGN